MTEAEWLSSSSPRRMLAALGKQMSGRKQQLFLCGLCLILCDESPLDGVREYLGSVGEFLDGDGESSEYVRRQRVRREAIHAALDRPDTTARERMLVHVLDAMDSYNPQNGVRAALEWGEQISRIGNKAGGARQSRVAFLRELCDLLRELFPPPGVRYTAQPSFAGGGIALPHGTTFYVPDTAVAIALGVQHDQAFDRLPILADALEDANCPDRPLLDHLRHGTNHRRGCWALDVVLGRG